MLGKDSNIPDGNGAERVLVSWQPLDIGSISTYGSPRGLAPAAAAVVIVQLQLGSACGMVEDVTLGAAASPC